MPNPSAIDPEAAPRRVCVICGAAIDGLRPDARYCCGACRSEGARIRAVLSGSKTVLYRSLKELAEKAQGGRVRFWEAT
jgi:hypothetical protein